MTDPSIVAQGYDAVYEAMPRSPSLLRLWKQHAAGDDYPDDYSHISFVTLDDLRRLADALGLQTGLTGRMPDDVQKERRGGSSPPPQYRSAPPRGLGMTEPAAPMAFADIACGMGGPGLWIARESGARVTGVDLSRVAIAQAAERAERLGMASSARFAAGSFAETGLEAASMDAAMSVDALQYAPDKHSALREFARIVRPGGRLAFFAFELHPERARGLPAVGDDPVGDYRPLLEEAGFQLLTYEETPRWHERLSAAYGAVIGAQDALRAEMGELAVAAMLSEMTLTLERDIYSGRVFAVAELR
jgi:ubiquinone/menaquinone biosynthesis C-methylase UbiE